MAVWISRIFHPFVISLVTVVAALYVVGTPFPTIALWTVAALATIVIPPAVFIWHGVGIKRLSDHQVSIRDQRHGLYAVGISSLGLFFLLTIYFDAPPVLPAIMLAAAAANVIASLINKTITKISLHAGATAGCAAALFWISPVWGLVFSVPVLVTGWARLHTRNHTLPQILAGWLVAILSVVTIFPLFL